MTTVQGYAAHSPSGSLSTFSFTRRAPRIDDVAFKVTHCGICHSDLHQIRNEWGTSIYPMVPGHEIVGIVTEVGSQVLNFKVGDRIGVGFIAGSCGECDACSKNVEQYCSKAMYTFNGVDVDGTTTYGGFSTLMVVNVKFAVKIPESLPLDAAAPLLCAGITVYSPMQYFGMTEKGKHMGVVGLGGLGHMAVKFSKAYGLKVTVISTSPRKEHEAKHLLGADNFLVSKNQDAMKKASKTLDYILDTVSAPHDLEPLISLLSMNGKLVFVGLPNKSFELTPNSLVQGRHLIGGSFIGGIKEMQEMLDFSAEKGITPIIEKITPDYLNTAIDRLTRSDVKYRFVVDFGTLLG